MAYVVFVGGWSRRCGWCGFVSGRHMCMWVVLVCAVWCGYCVGTVEVYGVSSVGGVG